MRLKPTRARYDALSDAEKRKNRAEWCMQILKADIDSMSQRELMRLFFDYHYLVAYPEPLGSVWFPSDREGYPDEERARETFHDFQQKAKEIIRNLENFKDEQFKTAIAFLVRISRDGICNIMDDTDPDFKYSYARQIVKLLDGKRFDDTIKTCPQCGHYYAATSKHNKQSCSNKCSMALSAKKRIAKNPELERRKNNLRSFLSRYRNEGNTDREIRPILRKYIRDRKYKPEEIPQYVRKMID